MEVAVKILPPADGKRQDFKLNLPHGSTVQDAVDELARIFGERKMLLINDKKKLLPAWKVYLNEQLISSSNGEYSNNVLNEGDTLMLLLALAGG